MAKKDKRENGVADSETVTEKDIADLEELSDEELDGLLNDIEVPDDEEDEADDLETEEEDVDESDAEDDSETDDEESDNEAEVEDDEEEAPSPKAKNTKVPLKKLEDERKKRQQAEAELEAQKLILSRYREQEYDSVIEDYRKQKKQKYIDAGYEEDLASSLADDLTELYKASVEKQTNKPMSESDKYAHAIGELKVSGDYYDNADAYAEQIMSKMKELKVSAKEAYNMVVDPQQRMRELEQRKLAKKSTKGTSGKKSVQTTGTAKAGGNKSTMSKQDMRVFRQLKQDDPSWTEEMYRKYMANK